ncbi:hypothetical protein N9F57_03500 [Gammaproteobacteria bacterium]|nr:hypothetical protein [Gammaproteobacteria bacterium]
MCLHQLEHLSRARLLSLFILYISGLFASNIVAQQATFSGNVLNIPKATVGQKAYSLDLGLSVNGANYDFGLLAAGGVDYPFDLNLISSDPIIFRLATYSIVESSVQSKLEQATALYKESIDSQTVQLRCVVCHIQGGLAGGSDLLFTRSSSTSTTTNFGIFSQFLDNRDTRRTKLLNKVRGIDHDGGVQLTEGSVGYTEFEKFLKLLLEYQAEV